MNGILTILMLTFFVVMHEAGHYFAARFSKVSVSEFFVGFGNEFIKDYIGNEILLLADDIKNDFEVGFRAARKPRLVSNQ